MEESLQRPPAPVFTDDSVAADTNSKVASVGANLYPYFDSIEYHVLLLRDLSISLESALNEGNEYKANNGTTGPVVKTTVTARNLVDGKDIIIDLAKGTRYRYYVVGPAKTGRWGTTHHLEASSLTIYPLYRFHRYASAGTKTGTV